MLWPLRSTTSFRPTSPRPATKCGLMRQLGLNNPRLRKPVQRLSHLPLQLRQGGLTRTGSNGIMADTMGAPGTQQVSGGASTGTAKSLHDAVQDLIYF